MAASEESGGGELSPRGGQTEERPGRIHRGWLYVLKTKGGTDTWTKQWFELTETHLEWYPNHQLSAPLLNSYPRSQFKTAARVVTEKKFSFKIDLENPPGTIYTLQFYGANSTDRDIWISFLKGETLDLDNCKGFQLRICQGKGLAARDSNGLSDPFCRIIHPETKKEFNTAVVKKNLAPVWGENFPIYIRDPAKAKEILIEVWDKDIFGKDFMGELRLPLPKKQADEVETWHVLQNREKQKEPVTGSILIQILRDPYLSVKD